MSTSAGCRTIEFTDGVLRVPLWLFYPTSVPAQAARLGPYSIDLALGAPVEGNDLPLVLLSHGTGGSPLVYRDLAAHLARSGFVVALPEHPGDNRQDNHLAGTPANLEQRPRCLRLAIDAALADPDLGPHLSPHGVSLIGHSMGGYTALAVAGGRPSALPNETPDGLAHPVAVTPDARVRALVLLAPATPWFMAEGSLAEVDLPILLRTAEDDEHAPAFYANLVRNGVRDAGKVDQRVVAGANHFSFLSPFPPALSGPHFPPSQDGPGFDRPAFQRALGAEIVAFLSRWSSSS